MFFRHCGDADFFTCVSADQVEPKWHENVENCSTDFRSMKQTTDSWAWGTVDKLHLTYVKYCIWKIIFTDLRGVH